MRGQCAFSVAAVLAAVVAVAGAAAARQPATPTPVLPDPAECRVEPRSPSDIASLLATPVARDFEDRADAVSPEGGEPIDAETTASIIAVVRQFIACGNAGEWARLFALVTDRFIQIEALDVPSDEPGPLPPEEQVVLVEVRDGRRLPDGRVVVTVVTAPRLDPDDTLVTVVILVREDGRWLIDEDVDQAEYAATPSVGSSTSPA